MENDEGQETPQEPATEEAEPVADPLADIRQELKNSKSESQRKLENIQAQLAQLMQQQKPQEQAAPIKRELIYDDPEEYTRQITERVARETEARVMGKMNSSRQQEYKAANLQALYPELKDPNSAAYQAASREYDSLPAHLHGTSEGMELAIQRAVSSEGLVPVSKRKQTRNTDDFVPATTNTGRRPAASRDNEIDPKALEFAKILAETTGRDPNDPKLLEGLKKTSKRKDWKRYS